MGAMEGVGSEQRTGGPCREKRVGHNITPFSGTCFHASDGLWLIAEVPGVLLLVEFVEDGGVFCKDMCPDRFVTIAIWSAGVATVVLVEGMVEVRVKDENVEGVVRAPSEVVFASVAGAMLFCALLPFLVQPLEGFPALLMPSSLGVDLAAHVVEGLVGSA